MNLKKWQIIVVIICLILGTLLHFTYRWSGKNKVVGLFSAVNESTWEHLKLVFYPMLLMSIIGSFIVKEQTPNYWIAQALGIITSILFITIFFYTYTGIIGRNFAVLDISSFIISILLGQFVSFKIMNIVKEINAEEISIIFLILLMLIFIIYTIYPPKLAYFKDPIDRCYGIKSKYIDKI